MLKPNFESRTTPDIANNNFKSFEYKAKLLRKTVAQPNPNQAAEF